MDYPLENLGPDRFQQLVQALLVKEFPNVVCFPVGMPDGGRDAIRRSGLDHNGEFTVYQVKFAKNQILESRDWVIKTVGGEADKVVKLKARGANNYVLITNVAGSSHLDVGSMDRLTNELSALLEIPVTCWWRDDLGRRLDGAWDIKLRYPELLVGQDLLRLILEYKQDSDRERRLNAMRAFLAEQYLEDQEVKFKQVELQNRLLDLFVDLPFRLDKQIIDEMHRRNLSRAVGHDNAYLDFFGDESRLNEEEVGTSTIILNQRGGTFTSQVVVEGAPGQGKSTLVQYLCQVHRIRLLNKDHDYQQLPAEHRLAPVLIPVKVDLRDLSEWLSGVDPFGSNDDKPIDSADRSVEGFLSRLIGLKTGGIKFDVNDVLELAKIAPLFLAFDGLDEVADIKRRADVVAAITKAINRIKENCPQLRVVVTSRPAAFANSPGFDGKSFPRLQLGSVTRDQILLYANKWMEARGLSIREREEFRKILSDKLDQPHLRDLSRNPMQLTILLSLIHTKGPALPEKRTSLYDSYVDLFFSRESTKNALVRDHLDLLKDIHRYLAWVLHSRAETKRGAGTAGRFSSTELKAVLGEYLMKEGQSTVVIDDVFNAMLERVVMIVSRIEGTHEFEVQPLREYFAARYLYDTAPYSPPGKEKPGTKPDRFDAIARNLHWLNVTRFFCGCFSKGELLDLADRLKALMEDKAWGVSRHPYRLAAMLMSDYVFAQSPRASNETVSALLQPYGIRCLLPAEVNYRQEEPVRLLAPEQLIIEKVIDYLQTLAVRDDLYFSIARFLQANCSPQTIEESWLNIEVGSQADFENWVYLGLSLDCLAERGQARLILLLSKFELTDEVLRPLWSAGIEHIAATNKKNADAIKNSVLQGNFLFLGGRAKARISKYYYLLPAIHMVLYQSRYVRRSKSDILGAVATLLADFRLTAVPQKEKLGYLYEFASECHNVSNRIASAMGALNDDFNDRQFLVVAATAYVEIFGLSEGVVSILFEITNIKRPNLKAPDGKELFDESKSIVERIAFSRRTARQWGYWKAQFQNADKFWDHILVNTAFWCWAPVGLIVEHEDFLSEALGRLDERGWNSVLDILGNFGFYRVKRASLSRATNKPKIKSQRYGLLLARLNSVEFGDPVFFNCFAHESDGTVAAESFRLKQALSLAHRGKLPWNEFLQICRDSRRAQLHFSVEASANVPPEAMDEVLRKANCYPATLWDAFQNMQSMRNGKKVKTLTQVAAKERWFN